MRRQLSECRCGHRPHDGQVALWLRRKLNLSELPNTET
ncbi:hypothetical protein COO91_10780 (plasmid) [Nostoc flagelliforme CCNUN1]|uniref:Uncharacterized protein n=1 Tax=Nostoc flagelliforme CCNUN1 TaxID=2038116 RepID=A0A2K8TA20_9NOSO|nr:hypothetical protein COO91_10780 [Nostoc flagelliforme CCNUN1]